MSGIPYRTKEGGPPQNDVEDEEEEIDESGYKSVRDAVLFAIEVSPSMVAEPATESSKADKSSPLEAALKCAYHLMQQRIISAPKDYMGILLYGTQKSKFYDEDENTKGGWSFPNCYLLTDLDIPEAEDVKRLKYLIEDVGPEDPDPDGIFVPADDPVSMHTMLFCANQIFQQKAANFTSRRLFIVTDNDSPNSDSKQSRSQATVRAKDLYDLGVIIELFPVSSDRHTFNPKLFWDDIVYRSNPSDPDAIMYNPSSFTDIDIRNLKTGTTDGITLLQSLLSTIASRATPKRALFSAAHLELAPDLRIGIKGFLLYKHQKPVRSTYIFVGGEQPEIVKGSTQLFAEEVDNGMRDVQKVEVKKAYTFGGEQVRFSKEELANIRDFGAPVVRLIGFKPMAQLPFWANIKTSTFIYPFEEDFIGSTRLFSALYQNMVKKKVFGLMWFIPRKNATPVLAAMLPTLSASEEESKDNKAAVSATGCPQGLHLVPLPFADDLRQNPPSVREDAPRAPDELVDKMIPIIEQLNLPGGIYDPSKYPNPSLQWHYKILQAIALEEDLPESPIDKTKPKYRQIDKRIAEYAVEWGNELNKVHKEHIAENPGAANLGEKRPIARGAKTNGEAPAKKIKEETTDAEKEEKVKKAYSKGQLAKLTVADLKAFAAMHSIEQKGLKADLAERVEQYLDRQQTG